MVGGSGMYADAVMFGMDKFPDVFPEVRKQIRLFYKIQTGQNDTENCFKMLN